MGSPVGRSGRYAKELRTACVDAVSQGGYEGARFGRVRSGVHRLADWQSNGHGERLRQNVCSLAPCVRTFRKLKASAPCRVGMSQS